MSARVPEARDVPAAGRAGPLDTALTDAGGADRSSREWDLSSQAPHGWPQCRGGSPNDPL